MGTAVALERGEPCRWNYRVLTDRHWRTRKARVSGWRGETEVLADLLVSSVRGWRMNGRRAEAVDGCVDVDFSFSPATNILPIRRLALGVHDRAEAPAAWLRVPELLLVRLDQTYERIEANRYRYTVPSQGFAAELTIDRWFVTDYSGLWTRESGFQALAEADLHAAGGGRSEMTR